MLYLKGIPHPTQPLDVAFMYQLSAYYEQAVQVWLREKLDKVVIIHEVQALFGNAYFKAATLQNVISGFKKTGIYHSLFQLQIQQIHLIYVKKNNDDGSVKKHKYRGQRGKTIIATSTHVIEELKQKRTEHNAKNEAKKKVSSKTNLY